MTRVIRVGSAPRPAPLLLLLLVLAGCGGDGGSETNGGSVGGPLPACAETGAATDLPAAFPAGFPLPEGTVIDSTREEGGFSVVEGYVAGDLEATADFFREELPYAGYELGEGDAEEHEAETEFEGSGVEEGRLKLHDISGCEGALTLELAVRAGG
jgi:hypothetical protein